jgi:hypothetical protein
VGADIRLCTKKQLYIMQNTILITLKTYQKWKKKCPKSSDKKTFGAL